MSHRASTLAVLFAALLLGCGGGGGSSSAPVVSVSLSPLTATVTTGGTKQFQATVSGSSNTQVVYSVQEGASGGSVSATGNYTAPGAAGVFHVVATSAVDSQSKATSTVTVVAVPSIGSFTSGAPSITAGGSTTLTAAFSGGAASVDQGVGALSSGTPVTVSPAATTTYTLTVTNAAGSVATATVTVTVLPAPAIASFTATPSAVAYGSSAQLTAVFSGGSGAVDQGVGAISSGTPLASGPITASKTFTLTVTNALGATATASTTVSVAPPATPVVTLAAYLTAGKAGYVVSTQDQGAGMSYSWTLNGGSITAGQGTHSLTFTAGSVGAFSASVSVTNVAGSVGGNATASIVAPPVATIFAQDRVLAGSAGNLASVQPQAGASYLWTLSGASASGSISSGAASNVAAYSVGSTAGSYQLSVSVQNQAGDSVSDSRTLNVVSGAFLKDPRVPAQRSSHTATLLADGRLLVVGGQGSVNIGDPTANAELYDPYSGTWACVGTTDLQRTYHTATQLADGRVLVVGGSPAASGSALASAVIYDPATRSWSGAGTLTTARYQHTATLLPSGKVLVSGGVGTSPLASAELYDPAGNSWSPAGSFSAARCLHAATLLPNGKVLLSGGLDASTLSLASTESYDPGSNSWAAAGSTAPLATSRAEHTATLLPSGQLIVAGGIHRLSSSFVNLNSTELYDPAANTWSGGASSLGAVASHQALLLADGRLVLLGNGQVQVYTPASNSWNAGLIPMLSSVTSLSSTLLLDGRILSVDGTDTSSSRSISSVEAFDSSSGTSSAVGQPYPAKAQVWAGSLADGRVLVAGGLVDPTADPAASPLSLGNSVQIYTPSLGTWVAGKTMGTPRYQSGVAILASGKLLVAAGRAQSGSILGSAELYDPAADTWSAAGSVVVGRFGPTATLLQNGKVLLVGGQRQNPANPLQMQTVGSVDLYDPSTNTWSSAAGLPSPRCLHTATMLPSGKVLVQGGQDSAGNPSATFTVYDPTANSWSAFAAIPGGAAGDQAILLGNGKVLLISRGTTASLYDPSSNSWSSTGPLAFTPGVAAAASILADGRVVILGGGQSSSAVGPLATAQVYDPVANSWSATGSLVLPRCEPAALLLADGSVLVVGGYPNNVPEFFRP